MKVVAMRRWEVYQRIAFETTKYTLWAVFKYYGDAHDYAPTTTYAKRRFFEPTRRR